MLRSGDVYKQHGSNMRFCVVDVFTKTSTVLLDCLDPKGPPRMYVDFKWLESGFIKEVPQRITGKAPAVGEYLFRPSNRWVYLAMRWNTTTDILELRRVATMVDGAPQFTEDYDFVPCQTWHERYERIEDLEAIIW